MPRTAVASPARPRHDLLDADGERELLGRWRDGRDEAARDRLVACNRRLVLKVARVYEGRGLDRDDLEQHGLLGLLKAIDRFDPDLGVRLATYATPWIKQAIRHGIRQEGSPIRVPEHAHKARSLASRGLPVPEQICRPEFLARTLALADRALSCRALGAGGEESDLVAPAAEDDGPDWLDPEAVPGLLDALPPRWAEVVRRRFGLGGREPETLEVIARSMGRNVSRVHQIEARALARMRDHAARLAAPHRRVAWPGPGPSPSPAPQEPPPVIAIAQERETGSPSAEAGRPVGSRPRPNRVGRSGYRGVTVGPRGRGFIAFVQVGGRRVYAGYSLDAAQAARLYDAKARELLGGRAVLNFPDEAEPAGPVDGEVDVAPAIGKPAPDPRPAEIPENRFSGISGLDPEIAAIRAVAAAMAGLDARQAGRVLAWALARFAGEVAR